MAQILGKSFCCVLEYNLKMKWVRHSGNPSVIREIYYANYVAQILGKSFCCMQECILKIQWLRYSGNPPVVCRKYSDNSMAQILGKSSYCMQEYILKIQWLRYSGNPSVVCRNKPCKFNGSDTRGILVLYAGRYSDNYVAQILGKSFCCMQEHILTIQWLRYSGNPSVVCTNIH